MIIFPHRDNAQSTGHNQIQKLKKKYGHPLGRLGIGDVNSTPVYNISETLN